MERPIHTKFDIYACILTLINTTENYHHRAEHKQLRPENLHIGLYYPYAGWY